MLEIPGDQKASFSGFVHATDPKGALGPHRAPGAPGAQGPDFVLFGRFGAREVSQRLQSGFLRLSIASKPKRSDMDPFQHFFHVFAGILLILAPSPPGQLLRSSQGRFF